MAIEEKRGCGFRVVGGLYLIGPVLVVPCDRLPLPIGSCPVCGQGIKFTRSITRIDAYKLWHNHEGCEEDHACNVCRPPVGISYLMMVGDAYYSVESFITEAIRMGISKRIPAMPRDLAFGKTVVYLAHIKAVVSGTDAAGNPIYQMGVFAAFRPVRVEMLIWKSEATPEKLDELKARGITLVVVPDGDLDHMSKAPKTE